MTPKQLYDLKLNDLRECPIWAYLSEDDPGATDECTVVPCDPEAFAFETMYVALATFELGLWSPVPRLRPPRNRAG